jgi:hypothetical protein
VAEAEAATGEKYDWDMDQQWEVTATAWQEPKVIVAAGWEPFARTGGDVWMRRRFK